MHTWNSTFYYIVPRFVIQFLPCVSNGNMPLTSSIHIAICLCTCMYMHIASVSLSYRALSNILASQITILCERRTSSLRFYRFSYTFVNIYAMTWYQSHRSGFVYMKACAIHMRILILPRLAWLATIATFPPLVLSTLYFAPRHYVYTMSLYNIIYWMELWQCWGFGLSDPLKRFYQQRLS